VKYEEIEETIISRIIKPVLEPTGFIDSNTKYYINPTGRFVVVGPFGDPSKVDRSAAYMGRYIAKNSI
jgi:S-adenosylmethionine synthetase